ncbi:MAG: MutS-related protein, partial [Bryobacteraceae bacterium]
MDPVDEYTARSARWRAGESRLQRQFIRLGNARLLTGIAFAILAGFAFGARTISAWWLLVPLAVFIVLALALSRVIKQRAFAARAIRYYEQRLTRVAEVPAWIGKGAAGDRFRDPSHVYSEDLDLFGKGSLFELLSSARTAAGEQMLASWLLSPATREAALERQAAVRELRGRLDLREEIGFIGEDVRSSVDIEKLAAWGASPPVAFARMLRPLAFVLS